MNDIPTAIVEMKKSTQFGVTSALMLLLYKRGIEPRIDSHDRGTFLNLFKKPDDDDIAFIQNQSGVERIRISKSAVAKAVKKGPK